ncbi:hypothetical protein [Pseudomonas sp. NPDC089569]|uniref:hypothetical protein n=1 Tax=Pseudomonas sp. NPDC089569 TaxID=3390722 RepID=UPI003CFCCDE3
MTDKYKSLRDSCEELRTEAQKQGAMNPRAMLILELLQDYDAGIAREAGLRTLLESNAADAELMGVINSRRIGIEHEYEGPTIATVWDDEDEAVAKAEGRTAQEAILAAVAQADAKAASE